MITFIGFLSSKRKAAVISAFFMACLGGSEITIAQTGSDSVQSLYDLSIEELLEVSVVSTTKSSMSIEKAPGSVRIFTRKDFEKNGYFTLQDVLYQIPGIQIEHSRSGHSLVWVRGVQSRYNNKVLLLIDGVPQRDSYYGNFRINEIRSLRNVERVEVINGPGSVLYGANGFAGIINITTRTTGPSLPAR